MKKTFKIIGYILLGLFIGGLVTYVVCSKFILGLDNHNLSAFIMCLVFIVVFGPLPGLLFIYLGYKKDEHEDTPDVDQNLLTDEQKSYQGYHFPWAILISCGVIVLLMIVCIIVIINIK